MQHPDFTQQLANDRQARYRADASRSRLTRPDRRGGERTSRPTSDRPLPKQVGMNRVGLDYASG